MRGVRRSLREKWRQFRGSVPLLPRKCEVVQRVISADNTHEPGGECYLIAQEVKSAEYRRRVSSTYTIRTCTRGMVLHMLGGQEACTGGAMIHKAAVRRYRHERGTKGAHQQVLMHA
jgi:hypothetical protein